MKYVWINDVVDSGTLVEKTETSITIKWEFAGIWTYPISCLDFLFKKD